MGLPWSRVTRMSSPRRAWAAVAPSRTRTSGRTSAEFRLDPRQTGFDLLAVRALVEAALASGRGAPLEMLHDVGDEDRLAVDPGLREGLVEKSPGRPDERLALEILVIAGLLADEHPASGDRTHSEDGLGRVGP